LWSILDIIFPGKSVVPSGTSLFITTLIILSAIAGCMPAAPVLTAPDIEIPPQLAPLTLQQPDGVWFEAMPGRTTLTYAEQERIAAWVFDSLFPAPGSSRASLPVENAAPAMLFLSLSDGSSKADVLRASGLTIQSAVEALVSQVDVYLLSNAKPLWAKLDLVDEVIAYDGYDLSSAVMDDASLFGLAFQGSSRIALLPEVLAAETIFDRDQKFQLSNLADYLEEQSLPVDILTSLDPPDIVPVFRFSTDSFFYQDGAVIPLYRGHRVVSSPSPGDLLSSAVGGGNYLTNAVREDGRFVYSYQPATDKESDAYNILRHTGTVYAMADLYQLTGDPRLLAALDRALDYLRRQIQKCQINGIFENCIVEQGETKLGGNGLAVLAFSQYMQATGTRDLLDETRSLARWIVATQSASGQFMIHKVHLASGETTDFVSDYYPGEAIYGLARLYQLDKNDQWLSAASKGARWLAADRIQGKAQNEIEHDHWLLLGLDELQHINPDPAYMDAAIRIADAIIVSQNLEPEFADWFGGFYKPPRSTPNATRAEGLLAAYRVTRDYGTKAQSERILRAARNSIAFQLGTQFQPESAMYFSDPQRILGGFHQSLTDFEIRNDYVQHNISSILALYRSLSDNLG